MASMRQLNARLATWQRYARKAYWNPRVTGPRWMRPGSATACSPGHTRAWNAREHERERRADLAARWWPEDDWEWDAARTARPIETVDTGGLT